MRKILISLIFIILFPFITFSQINDESYDRLSISHVLVLYNGDRYNQQIEKQFINQRRSDKYDAHQVEQQVIYLPQNSKHLDMNSKLTKIYQVLKDKKIPKAIIAKWYNRKKDGSMNLELIHSRGRYNADDYEYTNAQLTKRGNSYLKDYGNKLIDKTYIIVTEITDIQDARRRKKSKYHGFTSTNNTFVYKLNFKPEVRSMIYNSWIYSDDTKQIINEKIEKFENIDFPIKPITVIYKDLNYTQSNDTKGNILYRYKSDKELFTEMIEASYQKPMHDLSSDYEDFKVKTYIDTKSPLKAKIGLKEGLSVDQRFYVYEYVWDEDLDKAVTKRKAVIRAKEITDNRSIANGHSNCSRFYQTAGWTIDEGMLIEQRNDIGASLAAGWETGKMGGFSLRGDLRTGKFTSIASLYVFADVNFSKSEYSSKLFKNIDTKSDFIFTKFSVGIAKGFNFAYNFEFMPFVSYGMEFANNSNNFELEGVNSTKEYSSISSSLIKYGASLTMNITHNVQLYGTFAGYNPIGNITAGKKTKTDIKWTDVFEDREGFTKTCGLRVLF